MEFNKHEIKKGDTLESIAEEYSITTKQLINFHNSHSSVTQQIFGDQLPVHIQIIIVPVDETERIEEPENIEPDEENARYRCEQSVMTYIKGVLINHIDTKREFLVRKFQKNNQSFIKTELVENIIHSHPEQMKEAVDLITDIDLLACNLLVTLNTKTGKIDTVKNFQEVKDKWIKHKEHLKAKYSFLRNSETRKNVEQFLAVNDETFNDGKKLIEWVNNKMFFDLFFDKYLITNKELFNSYKRTLYSQLFEGKPVELNFKQDILGETKKEVNVRKVSEMIEGNINRSEFEEIYNIKFKPIVNYQFSEFKLSYRENTTYDMENRWINTSDVTIIEEIKNNVRLMISYTLTKIEI